MKRIVFIFLLSFGFLWGAQKSTDKTVKNIIILIPDGMSVGGYTLARWYKGGSPLAMDELICGLIRTYNSDSLIADSAPAATAYACGYKAVTKNIGVMPEKAGMPGVPQVVKGEENKPIANIFEAARLKGKATGLVFTCELPHATPAGFSAHSKDRSAYDDISEQQVYCGLDVVFGGGWFFLTKEGRKDGEDLLEVVKKNYFFISNRTALFSLKKDIKRVWGLFTPKAMSYDFDRTEEEPSIAEMTTKAIEILSRNTNGFILMVEGSKIDWASHANDPVGVISDILAFDEAVKVAKEFAKTNKNTLVIVAPDHGNGGITIGNTDSDKTYDKLVLDDIFKLIKTAKKTGEGIENLISITSNKDNISNTLATYYGIQDVTEEEVKNIILTISNKKPLNYIVGPMISKRSYIGWTTHGHTGEDVIFGIYSPKNDHPKGVIENTDIAKIMEKYFSVSLNSTTQELFIEAKEVEKKGATLETDKSDQNNPLLIIKYKNNTIKLPVNKNIAIIDKKEIKLKSVTIYINEKWYISREIINLIK
ncbi:MAG: alkaline phosphatase [Brevinematales bacterium]|nr:alkaline phosphatase [Brevinematales bacterium]